MNELYMLVAISGVSFYLVGGFKTDKQASLNVNDVEDIQECNAY